MKLRNLFRRPRRVIASPLRVEVHAGEHFEAAVQRILDDHDRRLVNKLRSLPPGSLR